MSTITISKKEYRQLLKDAELLTRLEGAGVDNWEGWDYARGGEYTDGVTVWDAYDQIDEDYKD
jgi:hypothetical protein